MRHILQFGRDLVVGHVGLAQKRAEGVNLGLGKAALLACASV